MAPDLRDSEHVGVEQSVASAIGAGLSFLEHDQLPSGELPSYWRFPEAGETEWVLETSPFATALALIALARVPGADLVRAKSIEFLVSEMERPGVWRHFGAGSAQHRYSPPDLDDTACASMAVNLGGIDTGANRSALIANRSVAGTFHTWIVPRRPLPTASAWWRAGWSELPAWPRRRPFWRETSARPDDVDGVVNAHVVNYLGPEESTWAASAYLVDVIALNGEDGCDKWYPDPTTRLHYALSRSIRDGNRVLGSVADVIAERLMMRLETEGDAGGGLSTALAAAALDNLGHRGAVYEKAVAAIVASQQQSGSWPRDPVYVGGPDPSPVWASEAVATATCLEVLAGYCRSVPTHGSASPG